MEWIACISTCITESTTAWLMEFVRAIKCHESCTLITRASCITSGINFFYTLQPRKFFAEIVKPQGLILYLVRSSYFSYTHFPITEKLLRYNHGVVRITQTTGCLPLLSYD